MKSVWTRVQLPAPPPNSTPAPSGQTRKPLRNQGLFLLYARHGAWSVEHKRKMSEIITDTDSEKSHLVRYLDILRSLRFVDKEIQVTEKYPDKSRLGLYGLHGGKESRRERFILFSRSGFTEGMRKLAVQDDVMLVCGWDHSPLTQVLLLICSRHFKSCCSPP